MKFWDALMRRTRQADEQAANAIDVSDPVKHRQNIEDSKREIAEFENNLAGLCASRKQKERDLASLKAEVSKYEGFAQRAGAANDQTSLRTAVTKKVNFQQQVDALVKDIDKDSQLESTLKVRLQEARDNVAAAESKIQTLVTRENSAKIRQALAGSSTSKSGSALSQLNEYEKKVDQAEALAEAKEELAGQSDSDKELADKYGGTSEAIESEMAKYLQKTPAASA